MRNTISSLLDTIQESDEGPTSQVIEAARSTTYQFQSVTFAWTQIASTFIPALNVTLKKQGIKPLAINDNETEHQ